MNRQMAVKQRANSRRMEFGMEWMHIVGAIYSIPGMTGYLTHCHLEDLTGRFLNTHSKNNTKK
jgi:hypothetical protein